MTDKNIAKKEKAIELMKRLDIYKPYIKGFRESDKVCFFEGFGGFWIDQEPEVYAKMKAIEKKYGCLVYAVTHEFTPFGECYSFLIVSDYPEEWDDLMNDDGNRHCAYAYVWNKDDEWCSEFGDIIVQRFGGGIQRVAWGDYETHKRTQSNTYRNICHQQNERTRGQGHNSCTRLRF